jgi:hypothetical protein
MGFVRVGNSERRRMRYGAIVWLLSLAFLAQSFITQVHIHGADFGTAAGYSKAHAVPLAHTKAPVQDGNADCPFCQAIIHAGAFFTPPPIVLPQIACVAIAAPFAVAVAVAFFPPRPWYSRGPPQR